jgi:hypothetical protein
MADWYTLADLPNVACTVRLWWGQSGIPRLIDHAVRERDPGKTRPLVWRWYSVDAETRTLTPLTTGGPICWQPRDGRWMWPGGVVPAPVPPHHVPRLAGQRHVSEEAEAAELAESSREMEAERHFANQEGHRTSLRAGGMPWWWDVSAIRYEAPGSVSRPMVEGRVMRALNTAGDWRPKLKIKTLSMLIAALADQAAESLADRAARIEAQLTRFKPIGSDEHDFLEAMRWVLALSTPPVDDPLLRIAQAWKPSREQMVLTYRGRFRMTWTEIADLLSQDGGRISFQRAQQLYHQALDRCWRAANTPAEVDPRMTVLREANRMHRRRETQL